MPRPQRAWPGLGGSCWLLGAIVMTSTVLSPVSSSGGPQGGGGPYSYPPPPPPPPTEYGGRGQGPPPSRLGPSSQQGPPPPPQDRPYYPQGGPAPQQQQQPPPPPPSGGAPGGGYYPPRDGPRGPYPSPYGSGYGGYPGSQGQQQQQQQQQEGGGGFWSKLKNTVQIFTGNDESSPSSGPTSGRDSGYGGMVPPYGMRPTGPDGRPLPPALPPGGSQGPGGQQQQSQPPRPQGGYPGSVGPWNQPQQQEQQQQQGPGLWARLTAKVLNGAQSVLDAGGPSSGGRESAPPGMGGSGGGYRASYGPPGMYPGSESGAPKAPPRGQGPYGGPPGGYYGGPQQQQPPPPPPRPGDRQGPGGAPPRGPYYPEGLGGGYDSPLHEDGPPGGGGAMMMPPPPEEEEEEDEEAVPDIFTVGGDNIVIVNNPKALQHKLDRFARAGPQALQVITSFDGGLTRFQTADNRRRAETTESLLHNAVLMPATRARLRSVVESFDKELASTTSFDERYANREHLKREIQRIVATEGQIYISSIPAAVQDFQSLLPVRGHLEHFLKPLAYHGVPVYIFCSGYGDILAQLLRFACPGLHTPEGYLPPTLRIVSNLFRTGPDGLVNGFTYPAIHDLNSNMTTAKEFRFPEMMMGMRQQQPPPMRNALVVSGSLSDGDVAAGLGSEEQLRVGYVDRDRLKDLPRYLESFDAVVLGDGGMQYVSQLVEHVLGGGGGAGGGGGR